MNLDQYDIDKNYGCWLWHGRKSKDGYGVVWHDGKCYMVYRVMYEQCVGPVEKGKELDHICRERACVRPGHLEPVDKRENIKRRAWPHRAKMKHCQHGHELRKTKLRTQYGGYVCRECNRRAV